MSQLIPYLNHHPEVAPDAFVADTARVIGRVKLGPKSSVWYGAVLRGDINDIEVGEGSNIQDGTVMHVEDEVPCRVGKNVVVGHMAMLHGTTVGDGSLIGIGAILLTGSEIGPGCLVAARSLVLQGQKIKPGMLVMGAPAKEIRPLTAEEQQEILDLAKKYVRVTAGYPQGGR